MDQVRILLVLLYFSFFLGRKKELVMVMVMRNTDTQFSLTKRQQFLRYSIICRTYSKGFLFFPLVCSLFLALGVGGGGGWLCIYDGERISKWKTLKHASHITLTWWIIYIYSVSHRIKWNLQELIVVIYAFWECLVQNKAQLIIRNRNSPLTYSHFLHCQLLVYLGCCCVINYHHYQ